VAALRHYGQANENRGRIWCRMMLSVGLRASGVSATSVGQTIVPLLQELATTGVLVRVASTVLDAIGRRLDIPLAMDVAVRTADVHTRTRYAAMAAVARPLDIPPKSLEALNRLGRLCDRLSDILCGALIPDLQTDRFAVDPKRAADFAETFGGRIALVQVPLRLALKSAPAAELVCSEMADEVQQALGACLPNLTATQSGNWLATSERIEPRRPRILRLPEPAAARPQSRPAETPTTLLFPAISFAASLRRLSR
jgi:hypothetical protein